MPTEKSSYRAEIDGLRAFAVLSIVTYHAFPLWITGGFTGVDVFFVISGFLITSHIFEKLDSGTFSFFDFFQRRIRRIFPALILVMASSLVFGWFVLLDDEYAQLGKHVASGAAFIVNFVLANEVGYFDISGELKPMLHLWSLAVEEQFYIVWPLCLWFAWKKNFNLLTVTVIVLLISFFYNIILVSGNPTETFYWPFSRFWELMSGSVLAWCSLQSRKSLLSDKIANIKYLGHSIGKVNLILQGATAINVMSLLGFLLLAASVLLINNSLSFPSGWAFLPVLGTLFVLGGGDKAWLNRVFLMNPLAVWFGLISYSLYLWHWPILSYLHIIEDGTPNKYVRIAAIIVAIFLAWVTYQFTEKPIRFGKGRGKPGSILLVITMVALGAFGFLISKGYFSDAQRVEDLILSKRLENRIGPSNRWYQGKDDWLFLGNSYEHTVEKLRLAIKPKISDIERLKTTFLELSEVARDSRTKVALLVGPNKSTIYPEYLPAQFVPSDKRYFSFFADALDDVPNLILHDPTDDLLKQKNVEGKLYYQTDTHWNKKGAFLAYEGMARKLGLPIPDVHFELEFGYGGSGLMKMSGLYDLPLHGDDHWKFTIEQPPKLTREDVSVIPLAQSFGAEEIVSNSNSLTGKKVWVVGDSFSSAVNPYIYSTFKKIYYLGHWHKRLADLPTDLRNASEKPDVIIIVRVERSF
ncbi:acyltransferase family protein [Thalassospira xiamenensis]|uniref:acyltransferase family protein n=1 Tax=Thalassospira xiamenensis TaxID=220697 RepID=UPI003AA8B789